jgi:hypothetical protein
MMPRDARIPKRECRDGLPLFVPAVLGLRPSPSRPARNASLGEEGTEDAPEHPGLDAQASGQTQQDFLDAEKAKHGAPNIGS